MRRISLAAIGIFLLTLAAFSQPAQYSSTYENRTLKLEEINFVPSYYHQDGNNSAVKHRVDEKKLRVTSSIADDARYDTNPCSYAFSRQDLKIYEYAIQPAAARNNPGHTKYMTLRRLIHSSLSG